MSQMRPRSDILAQAGYDLNAATTDSSGMVKDVYIDRGRAILRRGARIKYKTKGCGANVTSNWLPEIQPRWIRVFLNHNSICPKGSDDIQRQVFGDTRARVALLVWVYPELGEMPVESRPAYPEQFRRRGAIAPGALQRGEYTAALVAFLR